MGRTQKEMMEEAVKSAEVLDEQTRGNRERERAKGK